MNFENLPYVVLQLQEAGFNHETLMNFTIDEILYWNVKLVELRELQKNVNNNGS